MMKVAKTVWLLPALLVGLHPAPAATFVVANTSDNGTGSLRNAIEQANGTAGTNFITFNIPGTNIHTIHLTTSLPAITRPTIINGYSQPGATSNTLAYGNNAQIRIELDGSMIADFHGLEILASHSTVRGLAVYGFPADAVLISGDAASSNVVAGNFIGTDATGTNLIGNLYSGVHLESGASGNRIGGEFPGDRNRIAGNSGSGISLLDSETTRNAILGNEVFANGDLGIDLGYDGVTTNDFNDSDGGPNGLQNFPTITYAESDSGSIQGTLTSAPTTAYRIEFFASDTPDASGFGQGQTFLGATNLMTDSGGTTNFSFTTAGFIPPDAYVTASATDPFGNTSEFSQVHAATSGPPASKLFINGVLITNDAVSATNIAYAELRSTFSTSGIF